MCAGASDLTDVAQKLANYGLFVSIVSYEKVLSYKNTTKNVVSYLVETTTKSISLYLP